MQISAINSNCFQQNQPTMGSYQSKLKSYKKINAQTRNIRSDADVFDKEIRALQSREQKLNKRLAEKFNKALFDELHDVISRLSQLKKEKVDIIEKAVLYRQNYKK